MSDDDNTDAITDVITDDISIERVDDGYALIEAGRRIGLLAVQPSGDPAVVVLPHTEVDPAHEGRHLGRRLVQAALDDIDARGERIVPTCPFVVRFLEQHPDYRRLVAEPA